MRSAFHALLSPGLFRLFLASAVVVSHLTRLEIGRPAVSVFFLLSGYWVARMFESKYAILQKPVVAFYISRFWRLFPVFAACQLLAMALYWRVPDLLLLDGTRPDFAPLWVFRAFTILGTGSQPLMIAPAWSLDVEMQFYLLLPISMSLLALVPRPKRAGAALVLGLLFLPLSWNMRGLTTPFLPAHLSFFCFGIANADARWQPSRRLAFASIFGCAGAILAVLTVPATRALLLKFETPLPLDRYHALFTSFLALGIAPFVAYSVNLKSSSLDKHLGNFSYPFYLFHWLPFLWWRHHFGPLSFKADFGVMCAEIATMVGGALLIYWFIDRPCDAWRAAFVRRHFPRAAE